MTIDSGMFLDQRKVHSESNEKSWRVTGAVTLQGKGSRWNEVGIEKVTR